MYCGKCKIITPTNNFEIIDKTVVRNKKNGEVSTNVRKSKKGICGICNTKKHLFAGNVFKRNIEDEVDLDCIVNIFNI